jgi:hypothetical protein
MADKEERILITKCSSHCHALRFNCDPFDDDDGMYCDKSGKWVRITEKDCTKCKAPVLLGLSRSEAIEKMAKAIFTQIWGLPNNRFDLAKSSVKVRNRKLAEAALNALLEDKK